MIRLIHFRCEPELTRVPWAAGSKGMRGYGCQQFSCGSRDSLARGMSRNGTQYRQELASSWTECQYWKM